MMSHRELSVYLNDHLAALTASVALFERVAAGLEGSQWHARLSILAEDVAEDRDSVRQVMDVLEVDESRAKQVAGLVAERLGRLKPNGHLLRRSSLTDLEEVEGLRVSVAAKIAFLQVMRALAVRDARLSKTTFETMLDRAQDQADRLYRLHLQVAQEAMRAA